MQNNKAPSRAPQRVRNELRFRHITVTSKTKVADKFWRIVFNGSDLAGFHSPGFDDHIKVFFPEAGSGTLALPQMSDEGIVWQDGVRPPARDYTPLEFDGESSLTLDFYIHESGVASDWATQAQPGDTLIMGGPRGSLVVPTDYAFQLYVCDETGLPAFKRRKADIQAETLHLFAYTDEETGRGYLADLADVSVNWAGNGNMQSDNLGTLIAALDKLSIPQDDYFIWLTGEGEFVKTLSDYFTVRRGLDPAYVRAVAYWHSK
ncbi:siderophore-interacting protein [Pantoea sp. LMR881]|uniref:siderophore-interacting protein n=1 Tax=Pantoea sp. LMR881 TaxID=3014336 RepID=UPI0022AFCA3F|nr:siderophore-interacting protein [Pantoea sp. LMR881]MCZ4060240.1 siderophore-interacting protein [Pantoea sp. LMR881]